MPARSSSRDALDDLVRSAVGARVYDALTVRERATIRRRAAAAVRVELRVPAAPLDQAARRMVVARGALRDARRDLAKHSAPGAGAVIVDPAWQRVERALHAHRAALLAKPGVVGVGIGYRVRAGVRDRGECCVLVFVDRKRPVARLRAERQLPQTITYRGASVPIDVRPLAPIALQLDAGGSLGPRGIQRRGTLGTFAIDTDAGGGVVALTAMHVIAGDESPPVDHPPLAGDVPIAERALVAPATGGAGPDLGQLLRGSLGRGIDAAAVSVRAARNPRFEIETLGPIAGWRPLSHPGDVDTVVRMRGQRTGHVVVGTITEPHVQLPAYGLDDAILARIPSQDGDSGAAIVDGAGLVLGLLVGRSKSLGDVAVFTPIANVLARLRCDIPTLDP